ncbi:MAG: hypothetical protein IPI28_03340 [Candidatus Omnitrophica bacterium]|nr:hypothetical protein [Candidatus Omnitrophota bacterium]
MAAHRLSGTIDTLPVLPPPDDRPESQVVYPTFAGLMATIARLQKKLSGRSIG